MLQTSITIKWDATVTLRARHALQKTQAYTKETQARVERLANIKYVDAMESNCFTNCIGGGYFSSKCCMCCEIGAGVCFFPVFISLCFYQHCKKKLDFITVNLEFRSCLWYFYKVRLIVRHFPLHCREKEAHPETNSRQIVITCLIIPGRPAKDNWEECLQAMALFNGIAHCARSSISIRVQGIFCCFTKGANSMLNEKNNNIYTASKYRLKRPFQEPRGPD